MPTGAGVGDGPFHSHSNEAWFTHTPGLKVVYPAFPEDAKLRLFSGLNSSGVRGIKLEKENHIFKQAFLKVIKKVLGLSTPKEEVRLDSFILKPIQTGV